MFQPHQDIRRAYPGQAGSFRARLERRRSPAAGPLRDDLRPGRGLPARAVLVPRSAAAHRFRDAAHRAGGRGPRRAARGRAAAGHRADRAARRAVHRRPGVPRSAGVAARPARRGRVRGGQPAAAVLAGRGRRHPFFTPYTLAEDYGRLTFDVSPVVSLTLHGATAPMLCSALPARPEQQQAQHDDTGGDPGDEQHRVQDRGRRGRCGTRGDDRLRGRRCLPHRRIRTV